MGWHRTRRREFGCESCRTGEIAGGVDVLGPAADMQRALQIGLDQMKMWDDEREEAVRKVAELLFNGGTDAGINAAIERTKLSAETLFAKPDKSKS